ncbi:Ubiquitin carboxyl-terminal hydrolase [Lachnellula suecica]|uniref:Ubiquitin carboxyl-terminal hydrolase n=1 Tax=Lachnellula suecica TaxID=602035 RepID=A0A8T9C638_9HELO|nr:Ubiquitin carboxyl-terminal hydrolase [Lachnellula suecica]
MAPDLEMVQMGEAWGGMAIEGDRRRSSRRQAVSGTLSEATEQSIPRKRSNSIEVESSPPRRALRKRRGTPNGAGADPIEESMKPLTDEERQNWKGWAELESDPALFNFILREYGVEDVKVQEAFGLDDEMLAFLHRPVYGLIFLFRYHDEKDDIDDENTPNCPKHVWFANQTTNNACATIALLNIVMNVPEINLGEALGSFKETTRGLKPAYRGQRLSDNESIRNVHNSFARRMDMLDSDLCLQNNFEKWERSKKNTKRKKTTSSKRKKKDEDENGFHFIAYVPVDGVVWRLDGLQRQPINLGETGDDWIQVAIQHIRERIVGEDGVQFSLLSLCKSPIKAIRQQVAENMNLIMSLEKCLDDTVPDWKAFTSGEGRPQLNDLCDCVGLTPESIDMAKPPVSALGRLERARIDPSSLLSLHKDLLQDQAGLRGRYMEEAASIEQENEQAAKRKHDHTPVIHNSLRTLADAGVLKEIVQNVRGA